MNNPRETGPPGLGTQLLEACERGDLDRVKELIDAGASLDAQSDGGHSPLHLAARKGHEGGDVEVLRAAPANL